MELPRCYVASPLGFTEAGRAYLRDTYLPALERAVTPVDPWALTAPEEVERARAEGRERELALEIGGRNAEAIRSCTVLAAYLEGQEADAGTVAEVGFAAALGIRCFGLRTDLRDAGEPGVAVNLQVEAFLAMTGGRMCTSLDDLVAALAGVVGRPAEG